jgi:hypothetical protein
MVNPTPEQVLEAIRILIASEGPVIRECVDDYMDGVDERIMSARLLMTATARIASHVCSDCHALSYGHGKDADRMPDDDSVGMEHRANQYWHEVQARAMSHYIDGINKALSYHDRLDNHCYAWPNDGMNRADYDNQSAQLYLGCHDTNPPLGR